MPIPKSKVEAIEKIVKEYFPESRVYKNGLQLDDSCKELSFHTECIVGSFLREAFNITTSFIITPTRSLMVEVKFL
jgi:hypothetical protein